MSVFVYLLYRETSDAFGTSEVVGVFSTEEKAKEYQSMITTRRTFIEQLPLDPSPPPFARR